MNAKSSFYAVTSCTIGISHMKVADVSDKLFETCWVMFEQWCTDFDNYECIEGLWEDYVTHNSSHYIIV